MNSCRNPAARWPAQLHLWRVVGLSQSEWGRQEQGPAWPELRFLSARLALTCPRRCSWMPVPLAKCHCGSDRDLLFPAAGGVSLRLRFQPVANAPPEAQPLASLASLPAAAGPKVTVSFPLPAPDGQAQYRKMRAATGPARLRSLLLGAPFYGASGARSSICACLACNTPGASRATYAVTGVPSRLARVYGF